MPEELDKIYEGLGPDQVKAVDHIGSHARLLAGPGTGKTKTITRRVLSLILRHNTNPDSILLLTFTRLAAAQLRNEIRAILEPLGKSIPHVSTLHSFALKQILHNAWRTDVLPRPIRIADDWEERHIIQEDLKRALGFKNIGEVRDLIHQLSTDWETLRVDEEGWEAQFPNPAFLGALRAHRTAFGHTLRAELVYLLKRLLNQSGDFELDKTYKHVLIDEYQDLNACDLAIVRELASKGVELFVAGDDDQSIYGFRFAHPVGIRQFPEIYPGTKRLALEICYRCDQKILGAAEFVAALDPARLPKPTRTRDDAAEGEVLIIRCRDQNQEADAVAKKIKVLVNEGATPNKIAILLRSDRNGALSKPLIQTLSANGVAASIATESELEELNSYRTALSLLRLSVDPEDSLAIRSILKVGRNGLGDEAQTTILRYAAEKGIRFGVAVKSISENPSLLPKVGTKLAKFISDIDPVVEKIRAVEGLPEKFAIALEGVAQEDERQKIREHFERVARESAATAIEDFLRAVSISSEKIEQETAPDSVSILTMHQAKGLTFDVCFIVGAEDEFIPGRSQGEREGDERRLLYVSMSRARHKLYITFCNRRTGTQMYLGRDSGRIWRRLTRFLTDSNIRIVVPTT